MARGHGRRGARPGVNELPREARDGLARAWLAHLREQHPGITWVIVESTDHGDDDDSADGEAGRKAPATRNA